jgi:hypothetical protein
MCTVGRIPSKEMEEYFLQLGVDEQRGLLMDLLKREGMLAQNTSTEEPRNLLDVFTRNLLDPRYSAENAETVRKASSRHLLRWGRLGAYAGLF